MSSIYFDKKSSTWYVRFWQDGHFKGVRLAKRSDRLHSRKDVERSAECRELVQKLDASAPIDAAQAKLLLAARACGLSEDRIKRLLSEDQKDRTMLVDFVEQQYFPWASTRLRDKTLAEYRSMWNRYRMAEHLNGLAVADLEHHHVSDLLDKIHQEHNISLPTLTRVKFFLSGVLRYAAAKGIINSTGDQKIGHLRGVVMPKARGPRETHAYSVGEVTTMLSLLLEPRIRAAVAIAAMTGLGESELTGLQWGDYNGSTITVRRSIDRKTGNVNPPKTTKRGASMQVIPPLRHMLDAFKATVALGPNGQPMPEMWMFPAEDGGPRRDLDKWGARFIASLLKAVGLKWHGWHAFRRGFATVAYELNADDMTVQRLLRHAKVETSREHYIKQSDARANTTLLAIGEQYSTLQ